MDDLSSEEIQANASLIFDKSGELSNITVIPVTQIESEEKFASTARR
jgi:hypothetical protein